MTSQRGAKPKATPSLPGIHVVRAKGKTYFYAWRGGPRMETHPSDPVKFALEYAHHHSKKEDTYDASTIGGLVTEFLKSPDWSRQISERTKLDWRPWLDKIRIHFGALRVKTFAKPEIRGDIKRWRDQWSATPRTADVALEVLSRLLSYAVEQGYLMTNPVYGIKRLRDSRRSEIIWTDADLALLEQHGSAEIWQAAKLAVLTGLRRGDLLGLAWADIKNNCIEIRTRKSGGRNTALIPLYGALKAHLATIKKRSPHYVLVNSRGLPWRSGFDASWQKAIQPLGIKKHFHDLRGTAATRLFRAGFTPQEIAETLGWRIGRVEHLLDLYVKRDEILLDRIRRVDALEEAGQ